MGGYQNVIVLHSAMYLFTVLGNCHYSYLEEREKKFLDFVLVGGFLFHNLGTEMFKQIAI